MPLRGATPRERREIGPGIHSANRSGCKALKLERVVEDPTKYRLVVMWDTVRHHMDHSRSSPAFQEWRRLASPHWAATPSVHHTAMVVDGFGFPL